MKVVTLNEFEFNEACDHLAKSIASRGEGAALIGIRTGGAAVGKQVFEYLAGIDSTLRYYEAGASRFTSSVKGADSAKSFFKYLPGVVLDGLRVIEYYYVRLRMVLFRNVERSICLDPELKDYLAELNSGRIYVIDDAIDSGATINNLLEVLNAVNPEIDYVVAVLVVTQNNPLVLPDISLYKNVLLRFPWSNDCKS